MDVQYLAVAVSLFVVALACLLLFFRFGVREKSYEEALAEQRQQANALLPARPKPKDKKVKKAKKPKEKPASSEQEKSEESDAVSETNSATAKPHVEFKEPETVVTEKDSAVTVPSKKRPKKEKVKPILVNKEDNFVTVLDQPIETPPANHFELIHPKDEFELLHSHTKEEPVKEKQRPKEEVKEKAKVKEEAKASKVKEEVKSNKVKEETKQNKTKQPEKKTELEPPKNVKKPGTEQEQKQKKPTVNGVELTKKTAVNNTETIKKTAVSNAETAKKPAVNNTETTKKTQVNGVEPAKKVVNNLENKKLENVKKVGKAQEVEQVVQENQVKQETVESLSKANGIVVNTGKEKKKKKSEFNTLQQLAGDKQAVNLTILLNLVRKAELSRSEVQILIDLLLNKQHEAPTIEDWSEGKSDPVQKLKRQLTEKEKLLQEQQEALVGAQSKLREVRAEQNAEKSQFMQKIRQLEETLQNRQLEVQAANNRLHGQTQKLQQLQAQLNDEMINSRKIREEHAALIVQRQQMECRLAQLQETEAILAQLRNQIQDLTNQNQQLNVDLHAISEQTMAEKEDHQNYIAQLKQQLATYQQDLNNFQKDLEQKNEFARQQEETRIILERHLDLARMQATEIEAELGKVKAAYQQGLEETRRAEQAEAKAREELGMLQQQREEAEKAIGKLRNEIAQARSEIEKLQDQQASGAVEQSKIHQVERLNLQNEITSLKSQLQQTESRLAQEVETAKTTIVDLELKLNEQRNKNDELRKKNWKVMEALSAAESRAKVKSPAVDVNEAVSKAHLDEHNKTRKLLQRLFPEIEKLPVNLPSAEWSSEAEKLIRSRMDSIQNRPKDEPSANVAKLSSQVATYKSVIDETEGALNVLQKRIEEKEIELSRRLKDKDVEIEELKVKTVKRLQDSVASLEGELARAREEKIMLERRIEESSKRGDEVVTIERLSEEVNRLRAQLQEKRNGDVNVVQGENTAPTKSQTHPTNGPSLLQHHFSYSSSADSSLTEVTIKPKNKKKKKKGNGN